jgi:hypothetical protein
MELRKVARTCVRKTPDLRGRELQRMRSTRNPSHRLDEGTVRLGAYPLAAIRSLSLIDS